MTERIKYPGQNDLDELQELMARVDEPEAQIDKVVRATAVDTEFYNEMRDLYQQRAAQVVMKDAYYPYVDLRGEFMLGTDPDGRPVGVTRR